MSLTKKPKKIKKVINLLTDPEPEFVSLVNHGANQTPFKTLKADSFEPQEQQKNPEDKSRMNAQMLQKIKKAAQDNGVALQRMVFAMTEFETVDSVRKYLNDHGYEGGEIVKAEDEDHYEVIARSVDDFISLEPVTSENGVTRYLGDLAEVEAEEVEKAEADKGKEADEDKADDEKEKADEDKKEEAEDKDKKVEEPAPAADEEDKKDDDGSEKEADEKEEKDDDGSDKKEEKEEDKPAEEKAEKVSKYEAWWANYSDSTSLGGVLKKGAEDDGTPPAFHELTHAMSVAVGNSVKKGEAANISAITKEYGEMLVKLVEVFGIEGDMDEEMAQKFFAESAKKSDPAPEVADNSGVSASADGMSDEMMQSIAQKVLEELGFDKNSGEVLQQVSKSIADMTENLAAEKEQAKKSDAQQQSVIEKAQEQITELEKVVKAQGELLAELRKAPANTRSLDTEVNHLSQKHVEPTPVAPVTKDRLLRNEWGLSSNDD